MRKIKLLSSEKKMCIEGSECDLYLRFYLVLSRKYVFTFLIEAPNLCCSARRPIWLIKHFAMLYEEEYTKYLRRYEKLLMR